MYCKTLMHEWSYQLAIHKVAGHINTTDDVLDNVSQEDLDSDLENFGNHGWTLNSLLPVLTCGAYNILLSHTPVNFEMLFFNHIKIKHKRKPTNFIYIYKINFMQGRLSYLKHATCTFLITFKIDEHLTIQTVHRHRNWIYVNE